MSQKIADPIDRRIVKELSADARITNNELAERVRLVGICMSAEAATAGRDGGD